MLERTFSATSAILNLSARLFGGRILSKLFRELKRRNVFRVVIAYTAVAWLILQVSDIVFGNIGAPDWVMKTVMYTLAVGFPVAVFFAWAYELTPDGVKREEDIDRSLWITSLKDQCVVTAIISVLRHS